MWDYLSMQEFKLNCVSKEAPKKGVFCVVNIDTNGMSLMVIRLIESVEIPLIQTIIWK